MKLTKQTFVTAFALFSLFFGAGNLILPPFIGFKAGESWLWVLLGFSVSAVVIPILAIYGHAKLQGTMMDFAKKVSPFFALVYCIVVYCISVALPAPRTASVTYEMAIAPYFEVSSWVISGLYFSVVLVFVLNRSKILDVVGKFLTPGIICILLLIILIGCAGDFEGMRVSSFENTFTSGILEGYQTFDAIGGVVVGGVIVISLGLKGGGFKENKRIITKAGLLAGLGLLLIYGGLILLGAIKSTSLIVANRTDLLGQLSLGSLGNVGTMFLAVLVGLACFTTAVGIIAGTADFVKGLLGNSNTAYTVTALVGCVLGVVMGQLDVHDIIVVAIPALMFIYPITIVLILLNALPDRFASRLVFKGTILITILFSLPDFIASLGFEKSVLPIQEFIPLGTLSMGWFLPALVVWGGVNVFSRKPV